jgi:hypothetical protein
MEQLGRGRYRVIPGLLTYMSDRNRETRTMGRVPCWEEEHELSLGYMETE